MKNNVNSMLSIESLEKLKREINQQEERILYLKSRIKGVQKTREFYKVMEGVLPVEIIDKIVSYLPEIEQDIDDKDLEIFEIELQHLKCNVEENKRIVSDSTYQYRILMDIVKKSRRILY